MCGFVSGLNHVPLRNIVLIIRTLLITQSQGIERSAGLHRAHSRAAVIKINGAELQEQDGTRRDQRAPIFQGQNMPLPCCATHVLSPTSMLDALSHGAKVQATFFQVNWILCSSAG